jgi:hypothetical protein
MEYEKPDELEQLIKIRDSLLAQHRNLTQEIELIEAEILLRVQPEVEDAA